MSCDPVDFRNAMRGLASGISLITTVDETGGPRGMAATAVTSVSAEPPTLLICVNRSASIHDHLCASGRFAVNFLSLDQEGLVRSFSSSAERHLRFKQGVWTRLATGAPILQGAVASLDCSLSERVDAGTHTICIGAVEAAQSATPAGRPLVHFGGGAGGFLANA